METTTPLYIFKTDIKDMCPNCEVHKTLSKHSEIQEWSVDTEDTDCVLRVASATLTPLQIIELLNLLGHQCKELN